MTTYHLTIKTLSPVHIGSGGPDLRRDIDFAVKDESLYMLNTEAVLDYILPEDERDPLYDRILNTVSLAEFLDAKVLENNPELYFYKIRGKSHLQAVRAATKTVYGTPYIPGSSLKGALRTAWIRHVYEQRKLNVEVTRLGDRREWAFQDAESRLLSPKAPRPAQRPNYDLFRAIQVADSQPAPDNSLHLYNAVVVPAGPKGIPIDLEGIKRRVELQARLKADDYILQTKAREFGVQEQNFSFENLQVAWREQGFRRIEQEITFWTGREGGEQVLKFYTELEQTARAAAPNTFFIEVGWGTGWNSKTLGYVIERPALERIIRKYRLTRNEYRQGDRFPKTRRAVRDQNGDLRVPFGWLKITVE